MARIGDISHVYTFWSQNLQGRDLLQTPGVDGRIILKLILNRFITGFSLLNFLLLCLKTVFIDQGTFTATKNRISE